jgi:hypothetical protein
MILIETKAARRPRSRDMSTAGEFNGDADTLRWLASSRVSVTTELR